MPCPFTAKKMMQIPCHLLSQVHVFPSKAYKTVVKMTSRCQFHSHCMSSFCATKCTLLFFGKDMGRTVYMMSLISSCVYLQNWAHFVHKCEFHILCQTPCAGTCVLWAKGLVKLTPGLKTQSKSPRLGRKLVDRLTIKLTSTCQPGCQKCRPRAPPTPTTYK